MMSETDAINILIACKDLITRVGMDFPNKKLPNTTFTEADIKVIQGFDRVQADPIVAGPGLLGHLQQAAGLSKSEIIKLEQLRRLVYNNRHFVANNRSG